MRLKAPIKTLTVIIASLFIALAIFNNSSRYPAAAANQLNLAIATDPIHLDPAYAGDSASGLLLRMIYEGLTRLDAAGRPQPALAKSWTVSSDRLHYTFFLQKANWSNGEPIRAQDFIFAWQRMLAPSMPAPNAYHLFVLNNAAKIKSGLLPPEALGVKALNDQTLQLDLHYPCEHFLELLAFDAFYPVNPSHLPDTKNLKNLVCCGPFTLVSWKLKNELVLHANAHYWDKEHVKMDKIRFLIIADSQTGFHLFEKAELDWIGSPLSPLPIDAIEPLSKTNQLGVYQGASTYWIQCNLHHPLLKNSKARHALSLALDRHLLAKSLGQRHEAAYRVVPKVLLSQNASSLRLKESVKLAKKLWHEALKEEKIKNPTIELIYNQHALHARAAQTLQSQWKEHLGVTIKLRALDWSVFLNQAQKGNFDLARFGWRAQFSDPTTFLDIFESPEGFYNYSRWSRPDYHKLLEKAKHLTALDRRIALDQAEAILLEDLPIIPLLYESYTYVKNPLLKGVVIGPLGRIDFKLAYWEKSSASTLRP